MEYAIDGLARSKFADAGYDSANFIALLGPIFLLPFVFLLLIALRLIILAITRTVGDNYVMKRIRTRLNY